MSLMLAGSSIDPRHSSFKEETSIVRLKSKTNIYGTLLKMSGVSFVSETEIDEIRQKRQEEWEKVRKEDDPLGKQG